MPPATELPKMPSMSRLLLTALAVLVVTDGLAAQDAMSDSRIALAVLPLPEALRDGAGVRAATAPGVFDTLRVGSNAMMCTADRPGDDTFDVRCYERQFLAVMDARRALAMADTAHLESRFSELLRSGSHPLPSHPTAGYRMMGPIAALDAGARTWTPAIRRWQSVHFPFRTAEEVGITTEEEPGMPFVMASGTWWSHVMIGYPVEE
jgi:hypothetical protein